MPIDENSRYFNQEFLVKEDTDGNIRVTPLRRDVLRITDLSENFIVHECKLGDSLQMLARRYGQDARKWWVIAELNNIKEPSGIPIGTKLIVPSLRDFSLI